MSFIDNVRKTTGSIGDVIKRTYGPLAPLELPFNRGNVYRYPLDVGNSQIYPHTVEFQAWLPTPVSIDKLGGEGGITDKIRGMIDQATSKYQNGVDARQIIEEDGPLVNRNQKYNPRLFDFTRRAARSDLLVMYMPNAAWDDSVNNSYNKQSMTEALGNLGIAAEVAGSVGKAIKEEQASAPGGPFSQAWAGIKGAFKGVGDAASGPAGMEVAGKVLDNEPLANAGLAALGYAKNPQEELLYGGTDLREFMFEFTMTPRNIKEAQSIRDIIRLFKYHASPQYADNQGRYIIPPSYFDISFKRHGQVNTMLPRISTCSLTQVRINYSGGLEQWATYEDGMPIQIQMALSFTELEMMHKDLRKQGY